MEKLLTIAIPAFNMEKYICRCLDSLTQGLSKDVLDIVEIIVVNDGSTDRTKELAEKYAEAYSGSIFVVTKKNGHYGSCINYAKKVAKGKYFKTLDADDWFDTLQFIKFVNTLSIMTDSPDLIITDYNVVREQYIKGSANANISSAQSQNIRQYVRENPSVNITVHSSTFLTKRIQEFDLSEGVCYTDCELVSYSLEVMNTISVFPDIRLYQYFIGRDEQSVSDTSYVKNVNHMFTVLNRFSLHLASIHDVNDCEDFFIASMTPLFKKYYQVCLFRDISLSDKKRFNTLHIIIKKRLPELHQKICSMVYLNMRFILLWELLPSWIFFPLYRVLHVLKHLS